MFRKVQTVVLVLLAAVGNLAVATAQESKEAGSKTKRTPNDFTVDMGSGVTLEMVLIPAGQFVMGSPLSDKDAFTDEKPQHRVRITKPFYLGKYQVTWEQWKALMGDNPKYVKDWYDGAYYSKSPADDPTGPVTGSGRVARGGGRAAIAKLCRSAVRYNFRPEYSDFNRGLQVALVPTDR